jgi:hypothetical protein
MISVGMMCSAGVILSLFGTGTLLCTLYRFRRGQGLYETGEDQRKK